MSLQPTPNQNTRTNVTTVHTVDHHQLVRFVDAPDSPVNIVVIVDLVKVVAHTVAVVVDMDEVDPTIIVVRTDLRHAADHYQLIIAVVVDHVQIQNMAISVDHVHDRCLVICAMQSIRTN